MKAEGGGGGGVEVVGDGDGEVLDDDIAEVDTIVSLKDLVSQERIELAAKGRHCSHLPCFDVSTFLQLCQQAGIWQCPICYTGVVWEDVVVDPEMNLVLKEVDAECSQIRVKPDGAYEALDNEPKKKQKTDRSNTSSSSPTPHNSKAPSTRPASYPAVTSPVSVISPLSTSSSSSSLRPLAFPSAPVNGHSSHRPDSSSSLAPPPPPPPPPNSSYPLDAGQPPVYSYPGGYVSGGDGGEPVPYYPDDFLRADSPAMLHGLAASPQPQLFDAGAGYGGGGGGAGEGPGGGGGGGGGGQAVSAGQTLEDAIVIDDD